MKMKLTTGLVLVAGSLFLSACGGSGSANGGASISTGTASYLDSAVKGVNVDCQGSNSVTDSQGKFTFAHNHECTFAVGNITLRTQSNITDGQVIVEDNIHVAQFLQSMDFDGDASNGIEIDAKTANVLASSDITQVPSTDAEVAEAVEAMENAKIGYHGHFVNEYYAKVHMYGTMDQHGIPHPSL